LANKTRFVIESNFNTIASSQIASIRKIRLKEVDEDHTKWRLLRGEL